jgi:class 3 adenylate cyclase
VHIAARVVAAAAPGEIPASRTVRDLVVGSKIEAEDRGPGTLKGIDGTWQLFALARP